MSEDHLVVAPTRRRWPRRLLIGINIFVAVCLISTAGAYGYIKYRFGQIGRISGIGDVLRADPGSKNAKDADGVPTSAMNVLLVGSDSRKNISKAEAKQFGTEKQVGGERSDTIIILHIDPSQKAAKASILSIPRDLYVPIAETKGSGRINTAFEGGPRRLIATITQSLGISINHYAEVDFNGFRGIVNAIDGVKVYFPAPARDAFTGLNITGAGCIALGGDDALKYVRSRHYEHYESGRWRMDPTADLGRILRQQDFIRRVIRKALAKAKGLNVLAVDRLVGEGVKNLKVDDEFSTKDMTNLAKRFRSLEPDAVEMLTLPTTDANIGGASVLRLKQPEAKQLIDRFNGIAPQAAAPGQPLPNILPNTVRVRVLNGSGASGQATEVASGLAKLGFNTAGTGDAPGGYNFKETTIRYGTGQLDKARLLQGYVGGTAKLLEDRTLRGIDVALITGGDFAGVSKPGTTTTTTTAAPTATTATTAAPQPKGAPPQPQC